MSALQVSGLVSRYRNRGLRKVLVALAVGGLGGCAPELYVSRVVPIAPDCSVEAESRPEDDVAAGRLDVMPGDANHLPAYFAGVELLRHERLVHADGTYAAFGPGDSAADRIVITALNLSYQSVPGLPGLADRRIPVDLELSSGWGGATVPVDLVGPEVGRVLSTLSGPDVVSLRVTIRAEARTSGTFTTPPLTFPIEVFRSPGCAHVKPSGEACRFAGQSIAPAWPHFTCCDNSGVCP